MSHVPNPTKTEGTQEEVVVSDNTVQQLLVQILEQIKISNIYFDYYWY